MVLLKDNFTLTRDFFSLSTSPCRVDMDLYSREEIYTIVQTKIIFLGYLLHFKILRISQLRWVQVIKLMAS